MTNFIDALQEKIDELEVEKERIDDKIELLRELMDSEGVSRVSSHAVKEKRRPGRPKGSTKKEAAAPGKHALDDDIYKEAMVQLGRSSEGGTSPELQAKLTKKFNPQPRMQHPLGAGITAGTKKQVDEARGAGGTRKVNAVVSVDESDLGDD